MDRYIRFLLKFICAFLLTIFALWLVVGCILIAYSFIH